MTSVITLSDLIYSALFIFTEHNKWPKIQKDDFVSRKINIIELNVNQDQIFLTEKADNLINRKIFENYCK